MPSVEVRLEHASYPVFVQRSALGELGVRLSERVPHHRAVMILDSAITATHGAVAHDALAAAEYDVLAIELDAREELKSLDTVRGMYECMLEAGIERGTPVVAVGGGIVGDITGFAAATYLRGLPFVQVPTTLLAMVDASIGGKTGVNIPLPGEPGRTRPRITDDSENHAPADSDGANDTDHDELSAPPSTTDRIAKNMIGAFWQPRFVCTDPQTLSTLSERDYRCGIAECIKHGMISGAEHLTFIAANHRSILARDLDTVERLITDSVMIKARIVQDDEFEQSGVRALLNLGHTFAHAIESIRELDLRHGEAVAVGLCAAAIVSELTQRLGPEEAGSLRELIALFGLPTSLPGAVEIDALLSAMRHDKKVRDGRVRLVLPTAIGQAEVVDDVDETIVREAWRRVIDAAPK